MLHKGVPSFAGAKLLHFLKCSKFSVCFSDMPILSCGVSDQLYIRNGIQKSALHDPITFKKLFTFAGLIQKSITEGKDI
jgi:hypothetical protein